MSERRTETTTARLARLGITDVAEAERLWGAETGSTALDVRVRGSGRSGSQASSLLVFWSVLYLVVRRLFRLLVLFGRGDRAKGIEIVALRHRASVLRRQVTRPEPGDVDRVLPAALSRLLPRSSWSSFFVTPATCCAGTVV